MTKYIRVSQRLTLAMLPLLGAPSAYSDTVLTTKNFSVQPGASSGNLDGAACPTSSRMISGACHPYYNDKVPIINQFPNISGNTWRCGFKNNSSAPVEVYVYTVCAKPAACMPLAQSHLAVTLRPQQTDMWCWAASGEMVMEYLGHPVQQCTEANNEFGRTDCCNSPTPQGCVNGGWPEFDKYGFTFKRTSGVALSWDDLRAQLSDADGCARRPVAFSWHWPGGGGHMMVAIGYQAIGGVNYVEINDPWAPNVGDHRTITYDFYVASAGDHTHWDDFYDVQPK